jgi:hypothetical protein
VYDATAKMPSGLLNGNVNQLGDFDECLGIEGKDGIRGQYCLAFLQLDIDQSRPDLKYLHRLLHSHYAFRSNLTDVSTESLPLSLSLSLFLSVSCFAYVIRPREQREPFRNQSSRSPGRVASLNS